MWQPGMTLEQVEKEVIETALRFNGGNKTITAQSLGISVKTLYNKLETYGKRLQETPTNTESRISDGISSEAGLRVESHVEAGEKLPVPMRQREEIQKMSSERSASNASGKRR